VRELVFSHWQGSGCESYEDTLKFTSLIEFYLPYFPLEAPHLAELVRRGLAARGAELEKAKGLALVWGEDVIKFLVDKVGGWARVEAEAGWCGRLRDGRKPPGACA
jgi:hypothetical protein